eukprot:Skav235285  [mRNA]  locus=scaffold874:522184:536384:- [translate_table: standard]
MLAQVLTVGKLAVGEGAPSSTPDPIEPGATVSLTPKLTSTGKEIILLGFFDGIGSAALALQSLVGTPKAYLSWETDEACVKVLSQHFPHVVHRGDIDADNPTSVADFIQKLDSEARCIVLIASGPPCPDFSAIAESAQCRAGDEGRKFVTLAKFLQELEPMLKPREVSPVTENVVMANHGDVQYFTTALQSEPIVLDAADFGLINRPRIFWCRIDWKALKNNPMTGKPLRWSRHHRLPRLHLDVPYTEPKDLELGALELPPAVAHHHSRLPCLTTPAPTSEGRPPPKKLRGRVDGAVRQRWLRDGRTYAPWHYAEGAMLRADDGSLHTPSAEIKEQLHGFPLGYTDVPEVPTRARHRMLANSWHVGIARFILLCLLTQWGALSHPTSPPSRSALHYVLDLAYYEETYVIAKQQLIGDLPRLRTEVVNAVAELVTDLMESTSSWMAQRPSHVQAVYHLEDGSWVQIPVLLKLLEQIAYPGLDDLCTDLSQGFPVLGKLHAGTGWKPRTDGRYSHPIDLETFAKLNHDYVHRKLSRPRVDDHWETIHHELLDEHRLGRLEGPFASHPSWPVPCVTMDNLPLQEMPPGPCFAACSFAVVQSDKIRRCEDFRRSAHNLTVEAYDSPLHHDVDSYIDLLRALREHGHDPQIWGHDLQSAYRQIPLDHPGHSVSILLTPSGPMAWRHRALSFGATGSVWGFNRVADCLVTLSRKLLVTCTLHYVDDFGGTQTEDLLGVYIEVDEEVITISPCPERLQKLTHVIDKALADDILIPDVAHRLAGKLSFVTSTIFGHCGRALLRPLYGRAHEQFTSANHMHHLNTALRASLVSLRKLLADLRPRQIPLSIHQPVAVVYSDAFYTPGSMLASTNGWGYIVRYNDQVFYSNGTVPDFVLRAFCKSKAYIYFLEMLAHLLPLVVLRGILPPMVVAYIDNQPGLQALHKGYTKDLVTNGFFALTTNLTSTLGYLIHHEWVPSFQNISDPISRGDLSLAHQHGWCRSDVCLDAFWKLLVKVSTDFTYASSVAAHDCLLAVAAFDTLQLRAKVDVDRWHESDVKVPPALAKSIDGPVESTTTATRRWKKSAAAESGVFALAGQDVKVPPALAKSIDGPVESTTTATRRWKKRSKSKSKSKGKGKGGKGGAAVRKGKLKPDPGAKGTRKGAAKPKGGGSKGAGKGGKGGGKAGSKCYRCQEHGTLGSQVGGTHRSLLVGADLLPLQGQRSFSTGILGGFGDASDVTDDAAYCNSKEAQEMAVQLVVAGTTFDIPGRDVKLIRPRQLVEGFWLRKVSDVYDMADGQPEGIGELVKSCSWKFHDMKVPREAHPRGWSPAATASYSMGHLCEVRTSGKAEGETMETSVDFWRLLAERRQRASARQMEILTDLLQVAEGMFKARLDEHILLVQTRTLAAALVFQMIGTRHNKFWTDGLGVRCYCNCPEGKGLSKAVKNRGIAAFLGLRRGKLHEPEVCADFDAASAVPWLAAMASNNDDSRAPSRSIQITASNYCSIVQCLHAKASVKTVTATRHSEKMLRLVKVILGKFYQDF